MKAALSRFRIRIPHPFWLAGLSLPLLLVAVAGGLGLRAYQMRSTVQALNEAGIDCEYSELAPRWVQNAEEWLFGEPIRLFPDVYAASGWFDDALLQRLSGSSRLEFLQIDGERISDAGLQALRGKTRLQSLSISDVPISNAGLQSFQGLKRLTHLDLDSTEITDDGLRHLRGLSNLESLSLMDNQITESGLMHLNGLPKLERVVLEGTPVFNDVLSAVDRGDLEWLKSVLARNPVLVHAIDYEGHTLLHSAVEPDEINRELIRLLMDAGLKLEARTSSGLTVLEHAALYRRWSEPGSGDARLQFLLDCGADYTLSVAITRDDVNRFRELLTKPPKAAEERQRILNSAVRKGAPGIVMLLLDEWRLDPGQLEADGVPLLYFAAESPAVIDVLVDRGADVNARILYRGPDHLAPGEHLNDCTTLHVAAAKGALASVARLIQHGATIDAQDDERQTSLMLAVSNGHADVVQLLLSQGANTWKRKNGGETAFSIAQSKFESDPTPQRQRIVELLQSPQETP